MDELTSLARAAGHGDRAALASFIRQTQGDVWRLCAHLVDPAAADDLAQDTYLRAIPALRRFRGDAPARVWLLTIARRACATEIGARTRGRQLAARLAATRGGTLSGPPADPGAEVTANALVAALAPDRRAAFVLTQMLGCSYAEAAEICGCPVGTIRSRVARAREDLDAMTSDTSAVPRWPTTSSGARQLRPGRSQRLRTPRQQRERPLGPRRDQVIAAIEDEDELVHTVVDGVRDRGIL